MRGFFATPALLTLTLTLCAQARPDPEEVLAKARDNMLDRTQRLPNYTCVQTVDRKYFKPAKPEFPIPSCSELSAKNGSKIHQLKLEAADRLRLDVKVSNGTEIGAWAGAGTFGDGNVMKLIQGPFGTGGFGTFAFRPQDNEPWVVTTVTLEHRYRARPVFFPPRGQTALVCNFSFFTNADRYVMPSGYESQWTTVLADSGAEPRP